MVIVRTCAALLALFCLLGNAAAKAAPVVFLRAFAPSEGVVKAPEQPWRQEISLNGSWQFQPVAVPLDYKHDQGTPPVLPLPVAEGWDKTHIKIPSPWNVNAFNLGDGGDFRSYPSYPRAWEKVEMGWLRRSFVPPADWKGRRLILRFDAVAGDAQVFVNGHPVAHNFDLFMPFEADVTDAVKFGGPNELLVGVRKASLFDDTRTVGRRPYPAGSMWGSFVAGIWQDVSLRAVPALHIDTVYVQPQVAQGHLTAQVTVRNDTNAPRIVQIGGQVQPWINLAGKDVRLAPEPRWRLGAAVLSLPPRSITLAPGAVQKVALTVPVANRLKFWTPDTPNLYGLVLSLTQSGSVTDRKYTRFGWRQFTFDGSHQLLNGKPFELRGDSWHFLGIPQMSRRYAWAWFSMLKAAHSNAVRLHAQPYPAFYLDVADEMGICVLDETANWGSDGAHKYDSDAFWQRCHDQTARLVLRDRNHPAVFGWSVSNEVAWFIDRQRHPELLDRLKQGWADWLATAHALDPSRPWVSTDGDGDAFGIMPTAMGHYGGLDTLSKLGKPFGMGETGGAYFATPKYAAQFVGPRAYESQQGRMEGIAIEAYELIVPQRKIGVSYASIFNLAWYGLKPLELGLADTTRPYQLTDGIFFGPYRENQPGVQPERLGPYCSTFNPGYDPRLPLYRPWPLFDAVQAAYVPAGPAPSPWDHRMSLDATPSGPPLPPHIPQVAVLAANTDLSGLLTILGVTVTDAKSLKSADFIIIDGAHPPLNLTPEQKAMLAARVQNGATVFVWGAAPSGLAALNALLPVPLQLTDRESTSLLIQSPDPLLAGMTHADFYLTETVPEPVMRHGLTGPFVMQGRTLLAACNTDWRRWNNRPEPLKTAATIRSEREAKPAGAALVEYKQGQGRYLVSSLGAETRSQDFLALQMRMLKNMGVIVTPRPVESGAAFDPFGGLQNALVCGSFAAASTEAAYNTDNVGIGPAMRPKAGDTSGGLAWREQKAGEGGVFDFKRMRLPGPQENAAAYLSFWVWSPRALDNLLVEPNMPKLDLLAGSDDGCQIWLNDHLIKEDRGTHPLTPGSIVCESLPLQRGWNHFVVKVVQGTGEWQFVAQLRCSDVAFLTKLRTAVNSPDMP